MSQLLTCSTWSCRDMDLQSMSSGCVAPAHPPQLPISVAYFYERCLPLLIITLQILQMRLREEYDDLLNEMARGQPCDGLKGRPLGSRVPVRFARILSVFGCSAIRSWLIQLVACSLTLLLCLTEQALSDSLARSLLHNLVPGHLH